MSPLAYSAALVVLALVALQEGGEKASEVAQEAAPLTWDLVVTRDHAPLAGAEIVSLPAVWLDKDVGRDDGGTPWLVDAMRLRGALAVGVRSQTDAAGRVCVDTSALRHPSGTYGTQVDVFVDFEGSWQRRRVDVERTPAIELELGHVVRLVLQAPWPSDDLVLAVHARCVDGAVHDSWCRPRAGVFVVAVPVGIARSELAEVTIEPLVVGAARARIVLQGAALDDAPVHAPAVGELVCTRLVVKDPDSQRAAWTGSTDRGYPATVVARVEGLEPMQLCVRPGFEVALWAQRDEVVVVEPLGELAALAGDVVVIERGRALNRRLILDLSTPVLCVVGRLVDGSGAVCVDTALDISLSDGAPVAVHTDGEGRFVAQIAAPMRLTGWSAVVIELARADLARGAPSENFVSAALVPEREAARRQRVDLLDVVLKPR